MNYGINNVVGGFGKVLSPEEAIPYVLARTAIEHKDLDFLLEEIIINEKIQGFNKAIEIGCGYGRNIPALSKRAFVVDAYERDPELFVLAKRLYEQRRVNVYNKSIEEYDSITSNSINNIDVLITFTFIQHVIEASQLLKVFETINRVLDVGSYAILCEETDPNKTDPSCICRPVEIYQQMLEQFGFKLIKTAPRRVEKTFRNEDSGTYMVFKKVS